MHGRALRQKLRTRYYIKIIALTIGVGFPEVFMNDGFDPITRADRHGRFVDNDGKAVTEAF